MSCTCRLLTVAAVMLLAACSSSGKKQAAAPAACPVQTEVVTVQVVKYVPIRPELTAQHPIAQGSLAECPDVAAARRAELEKANAKLREIRAIQGTEVKP